MSENEKRNKPSDKKWILWILAAAVGLCLLLVSGSGGKKDAASKEQETTPLSLDPEAYAAAVEQQIVSLCEGIPQAGRVRAMVTLKGGYRAVYATDSQSTGGGYKNSTVLVGSGSEEQGILICYQNPEIAGVGILCEGGGREEVRAQIVALVSASLDLGCNKIYVASGGKS